MLLTSDKSLRRRRSGAPRFLMIVLGCGVLGLSAVEGHAQQKPDTSMGDMPGMDMSGKGGKSAMGDMGDMGDMGPSMAAMAGHMYMTPMRPEQPGDRERAKAIVAQVKATMERYKDYKKALADGYVIANPKLEQPQYHFNNPAHIKDADQTFDPTKPSSLVYRRTPTQQYKLEGVMFTDRADATEDELNARIPLSIARWHEHVKFCAAPANKVQEYHGEHPKFGMFGSITTAEACKAAGGTFYPTMFNYMVHVFPYEDNLKEVFSVNDDISHNPKDRLMPQ